jgi:signal transduction histidine kinase
MAKTTPFKHLVATLYTAILGTNLGLSERYRSIITNHLKLEIISDPKSIWWSYFPAILVALLGFVITMVLFMQSMHWEKSRVELAFKEAAQDRILVIQREIEHSLQIVLDIASFFEASEFVGRREFRKFVGPALKNQAGIMALKWAPAIPDKKRRSFIDEARVSFPPFQILERNDSGMLSKSPQRSVYYPILYVQPYQHNKQLLGLNMGGDPTTYNLLKEAEITRKTQVSPAINLNNNGESKNGFLVAAPVFYNVENNTKETPQDSLPIRGFSIGVFIVGEIIERALESLRPSGIDIHFYQNNGDEKARHLYSHQTRLRETQSTNIRNNYLPISYTEEISVGTQKWQVVCISKSSRFATNTWSSWVIFFVSLAFTLLLTIYIATLLGRARQISQEVNERTSQLRNAVQALNQEVIERKSAEQELQKLNEGLEQHIAKRTAEAERRAQYLEQFAYVASHDLKAPLRAVSNLAQWIEEDLCDKLDDTSKEQLALLRDRVKKMHDLIEGLLEYSRVGRSSVPENLVDTRELVEEIIHSLTSNEKFSIKIKGKMPTLKADRLLLGQVFSNLISNSLKHHGGKKGKIRIKCDVSDQFYQFSVCDDGQGIAPQYHDKIFLMFQTLESSDFESNTGIGLALVKKIVEEHGGAVKLISTPGEGACFSFTWQKNQLNRMDKS